MIRVAIAGVGGYGWVLIRWLTALRQRCDCRLVAAADSHLAELPEPVSSLRESGVALYDDARRMFQDVRGRCEAAYIATSIPSHADLTVAAAECGLHVHLEKPPAATVQEVDRMLLALDRAHESSGTVHRIGQEHWHLESPGTDEERVVVSGLDELIQAACRRGRLFSNLGDLAGRPAWAVATRPYYLDGYAAFPQRFRARLA